MFYEPSKRNHGLPRDPFTSLVVPRPIGWITTLGPDGVVNLAPYSFFNLCSSNPPAVMFAASTKPGTTSRKDSHLNAESSGEFVVNIVSCDLGEQMNLTSAPLDHGVSELALAGLETAPSRVIKTPRIASSPVGIECRHLTTVKVPSRQVGDRESFIVIGEVVGVHIDDSILVDGFVSIEKLRPVAKLGYLDYATIERGFTMAKPSIPDL